MKKITALFVIIAIAAGMLSGCVTLSFSTKNTVFGKGAVKSFAYEVEDFIGVEFTGGFELVYRQGEKCSVVIEMQQNLYDYVTADVWHDEAGVGILQIKSRTVINGYGYTASLRVKNGYPRVIITAPEIGLIGSIDGHLLIKESDAFKCDSLNLYAVGTCEISMEVEARFMQIELEGAGEVKVSGTADETAFAIHGAGEINAYALKTRVTGIRINGAGTVNANCSEMLDVGIEGMGKVKYIGDPEVVKDISGMGSVVKEK